MREPMKSLTAVFGADGKTQRRELAGAVSRAVSARSTENKDHASRPPGRPAGSRPLSVRDRYVSSAESNSSSPRSSWTTEVVPLIVEREVVVPRSFPAGW
jgi:hypothetical protein